MAALPVVTEAFDTFMPEVTEGVTRIVLGGKQDPLEGVMLPEGVTALTEAELDHHLGQSLEHCGCSQAWPVELNHAHSQQLLALRIRGKVTPLELVLATGVGLAATRVLLLLESDADLELLQVFPAESSSPDLQRAHSHVLEAHLGRGANLRHGVLASGCGDASLMVHLAIEQEPGSHYGLTSVCRGWRFGRLEPRVLQREGQATTGIHGLSMTTADEQFATHSSMRFGGPEGELDQLQKAVAADRSHSIFNGAIQVPRPAQRTDAAQLSRSLLLSRRARVDAKPELEIVADDVKCAHGATVSQLQQEELFYIRSRGVDANEAAALLLKGFCCEVVDRLPAAAESWMASGAIADPSRPL
tara:strand:- start:1080 stop:2156 length:1077 start_codon:yes stop_codon:yes gene_type:complete